MITLMECSGILLCRKKATVKWWHNFCSMLCSLVTTVSGILLQSKVQVVDTELFLSLVYWVFSGFFVFPLCLFIPFFFFLVWHASRDKKIFISQQNIMNTLHFLPPSDISNWTLIFKFFRKLFLNREKKWFKHWKVALFYKITDVQDDLFVTQGLVSVFP